VIARRFKSDWLPWMIFCDFSWDPGIFPDFLEAISDFLGLGLDFGDWAYF